MPLTPKKIKFKKIYDFPESKPVPVSRGSVWVRGRRTYGRSWGVSGSRSDPRLGASRARSQSPEGCPAACKRKHLPEVQRNHEWPTENVKKSSLQFI